MLRLLIIVALFLSNLLSNANDFQQCVDKANDTHSIKNSKINLLVKKNVRLIHSLTPLNKKILKHDPFLSLYLVEDLNKFSHPFTLNMKQKLQLALIKQDTFINGKIEKEQMGLNSLGTFADKKNSIGIVTSSCCNLEGLATENGVIGKEYLNRFINTKKRDYSDVGIRIKEEKSLVKVSSVNPYMKNSFQNGDVILEFDNMKIESASSLMKKILFSKIGTTHRVKVKRNNKIVTFNVCSYKRYGGGALSDTFLEQKGIYFDEKLQIIKLAKYFVNYGLKIGDKLVEANGVKVHNQGELRKHIADFKDFSFLLIERSGFQFFVKIN